jgi:hypothetical protein
VSRRKSKVKQYFGTELHGILDALFVQYDRIASVRELLHFVEVLHVQLFSKRCLALFDWPFDSRVRPMP